MSHHTRLTERLQSASANGQKPPMYNAVVKLTACLHKLSHADINHQPNIL